MAVICCSFSYSVCWEACFVSASCFSRFSIFDSFSCKAVSRWEKTATTYDQIFQFFHLILRMTPVSRHTSHSIRQKIINERDKLCFRVCDLHQDVLFQEIHQLKVNMGTKLPLRVPTDCVQSYVGFQLTPPFFDLILVSCFPLQFQLYSSLFPVSDWKTIKYNVYHHSRKNLLFVTALNYSSPLSRRLFLAVKKCTWNSHL